MSQDNESNTPNIIQPQAGPLFNDTTIFIDYLNMTVAGKPLGAWIPGTMAKRAMRNITARNLIHICFATYHNSAMFLSDEEVAILTRIVEIRQPYIVGTPSIEFVGFKLLVGKYGNVPRDQGYCDEVRRASHTIGQHSLAFPDLNFTFKPYMTVIPFPYQRSGTHPPELKIYCIPTTYQEPSR